MKLNLFSILFALTILQVPHSGAQWCSATNTSKVRAQASGLKFYDGSNWKTIGQNAGAMGSCTTNGLKRLI